MSVSRQIRRGGLHAVFFRGERLPLCELLCGSFITVNAGFYLDRCLVGGKQASGI